jgi:histone deacetylase 11
MRKKIPIVYSKHYDIGLAGMERLHPFDTRKHGKVFRQLGEKLGIGGREIYTPTMATEAELLSVHTPRYLASLRRSYNVAFIAELPLLAFVPNALLQKRVLVPMRYATKGTMLGAELAFEYGWAINLSGGYHHAKADSGGGFCFFADVPIALYALFEKRPELSVLIVDLDAHQGNGNEAVFKDDPRVRIFDIYNEAIYPQDDEAKRYIAFDHPVPVSTGDGAYLSLLEKELPEAIENVRPGLIVFIAGTDVLEGDFLGMLRLSEAGVIKRDAIVFTNALEKEIPILMLLGGGYTKKSAPVIAESIENIVQMVHKERR